MADKERFNSIDLASKIHFQTKERLRNPVVYNLYNEYFSSGILSSLTEIIQKIPQSHQEPIIHTLTTHVTKEKPLFIYSLGMSLGVSDHNSRLLAASVDLLWTLALILDDIEDQDNQRAGVDTAWVVYGKERAYETAQSGLYSVIGTLKEHLGERTAQLCQLYVNLGVESLAEHKSLTLSSSIDEIVTNYIKRADFHTAFPVEVLYSISAKGDKEKAISALREVNLAGQILNDIKDFLPEYQWARLGFSDIRNGLVTVPIKSLWNLMEENERKIFLSIFGSGKISSSDKDFIEKSIKKTNILASLKTYIVDLYNSSLRNFQQVVSQESLQHCFKMWVNYKLKQVNQIP